MIQSKVNVVLALLAFSFLVASCGKQDVNETGPDGATDRLLELLGGKGNYQIIQEATSGTVYRTDSLYDAKTSKLLIEGIGSNGVELSKQQVEYICERLLSDENYDWGFESECEPFPTFVIVLESQSGQLEVHICLTCHEVGISSDWERRWPRFEGFWVHDPKLVQFYKLWFSDDQSILKLLPKQ